MSTELTSKYLAYCILNFLCLVLIYVALYSGLIGRSWAMVFLSGGYKVKIYDNKPGQASAAIAEIKLVENNRNNKLMQVINIPVGFCIA